MAVNDIVPAVGEYFEDTLAAASPDLLRTMIREFAQRMMDAEVEQICGAGYGEINDQRLNTRNGYRARPWDTRAGSIELAVPRLRSGSYFPEFLLDKRRRAERALTQVVATSYLLGVSTRRVEKLAESMGITSLSKSQVSAMAAELDEMVEAFRSRPLDGGPYTFVWIGQEPQAVPHRLRLGPGQLAVVIQAQQPGPGVQISGDIGRQHPPDIHVPGFGRQVTQAHGLVRAHPVLHCGVGAMEHVNELRLVAAGHAAHPSRAEVRGDDRVFPPGVLLQRGQVGLVPG
ncbi:hypothetical protein Mth01_55540 [Sphaerimonospora thailandensis]|uniref:Mutator family transposase n=1 Tax=Sphaerimonospora thailandensis TaxID=795644 RepID=A0A8J3RBZ3_9ACTN|nr:hypothetical protein Mth01_55540 [Sphaerimonospora thailandensis]